MGDMKCLGNRLGECALPILYKHFSILLFYSKAFTEFMHVGVKNNCTTLSPAAAVLIDVVHNIGKELNAVLTFFDINIS